MNRKQPPLSQLIKERLSGYRGLSYVGVTCNRGQIIYVVKEVHSGAQHVIETERGLNKVLRLYGKDCSYYL